ERVDLGAPPVEAGQAFRARTVRIRDVVDAPAEAVDFEHRIALRARQDPHRRIERAARGALRRAWGAGGGGGVHARPHALRGLWDAPNRRPTRPAAPATIPRRPMG